SRWRLSQAKLQLRGREPAPFIDFLGIELEGAVVLATIYPYKLLPGLRTCREFEEPVQPGCRHTKLFGKLPPGRSIIILSCVQVPGTRCAPDAWMLVLEQGAALQEQLAS